jgi:hypothetical protein
MVNKIKCDYCDAILNNTPRSIGAHVGYHHKEVAKTLYDKKVAFTMKCLECGELVANSNNVLARHVRKVHGIDWPQYEVKHTHGGVWPKCACGCDSQLTWKKGGFASFIDGHAARGENNPMYGKKDSNNPNTGKKRSDAAKKRYSSIVTSRWKDKDDKFKTMFTPEYRKKLSLHAIDLLEQGKIGPQAPYKAEWKMNPFTSKEEYMHSSWETRFLDECIALGIPVTKQHGIRIPYTDLNGIERSYIPDFLTLDGKTLYEIKGYTSEIDREKWRATMTWCLQNDAHLEVIKYY